MYLSSSTYLIISPIFQGKEYFLQFSFEPFCYLFKFKCIPCKVPMYFTLKIIFIIIISKWIKNNNDALFTIKIY